MVHFGRTIVQALQLLWSSKWHFLGQSDVPEHKQPQKFGNWFPKYSYMLVSAVDFEACFIKLAVFVATLTAFINSLIVGYSID